MLKPTFLPDTVIFGIPWSLSSTLSWSPLSVLYKTALNNFHVKHLHNLDSSSASPCPCANCRTQCIRCYVPGRPGSHTEMFVSQKECLQISRLQANVHAAGYGWKSSCTALHPKPPYAVPRALNVGIARDSRETYYGSQKIIRITTEARLGKAKATYCWCCLHSLDGCGVQGLGFRGSGFRDLEV